MTFLQRVRVPLLWRGAALLHYSSMVLPVHFTMVLLSQLKSPVYCCKSNREPDLIEQKPLLSAGGVESLCVLDIYAASEGFDQLNTVMHC